MKYVYRDEVITAKPLNSGHTKQRTCLEQLTKSLVSNVTVLVKLPSNSGHLLTTEKKFKTRMCPLFRGFTLYGKYSLGFAAILSRRDKMENDLVKGAVTDMRYFARGKFFRS